MLEVYKDIIKRCISNHDEVEKVINQIDKYENYLKLLQNKQLIINKHNEELKAIDNKIRDFQLTCEHVWKYYSDPSGNNDSCYICCICSHEQV